MLRNIPDLELLDLVGEAGRGWIPSLLVVDLESKELLRHFEEPGSDRRVSALLSGLFIPVELGICELLGERGGSIVLL